MQHSSCVYHPTTLQQLQLLDTSSQVPLIFFSVSASNLRVFRCHSSCVNWQISTQQSFVLKYFTTSFCLGKPLLSEVSSVKASLTCTCCSQGFLLCYAGFLDAILHTYSRPYHGSKVFYGLLNDDPVASIGIVLFIKVG